jgi:hypothetical protein
MSRAGRLTSDVRSLQAFLAVIHRDECLPPIVDWATRAFNADPGRRAFDRGDGAGQLVS